MIDLRALIYRELKLYFHSKIEIALSIVTPAVYLFLFATSMSGLMPIMIYRSIEVSYVEFILPGIVTLAVFSTAMTMAQSIYNEQLSQMLNQLLSNPIRKPAYVLAKILTGTLVATFQATIFLVVGFLLFSVSWSWFTLLFAIAVCTLISICLGSLFQALCGTIKSMRAFIITTNLLYSVLLFASPIFYPLESMPSILKGIALLNPVTYAVNVLRDILLPSTDVSKSDFFVLSLVSILAIALAVQVMRRRLQAE